jgi:hypothetical protein
MLGGRSKGRGEYLFLSQRLGFLRTVRFERRRYYNKSSTLKLNLGLLSGLTKFAICFQPKLISGPTIIVFFYCNSSITSLQCDV